jgi:hypothetical protein
MSVGRPDRLKSCRYMYNNHSFDLTVVDLTHTSALARRCPHGVRSHMGGARQNN